MGTKRAIVALCAGLVLGACGANGTPNARTTSSAATSPSTAVAPPTDWSQGARATPPAAPPPEHPTPWIHMVDAENGWAFTAGPRNPQQEALQSARSISRRDATGMELVRRSQRR